MKKIYIIISLVLLSTSILFISCNNNESLESCITDKDCEGSSIDGVACVSGFCQYNPCLESFCGTGTCVLEDDPSTTELEEGAYCKCGEDSLPYKKAHSGTMICTPKCEVHIDCSEAYINEGGQIAGACIKGQCNEMNHCETETDCPDGNICDYNHCKNAPIEE